MGAYPIIFIDMIRPGTEYDVFKISKLWFSMVREMRPDLEPNPSLWRKHCFRFLRTGNYFIFVDEAGGRIRGFVDYFLFMEPSTDKLHGCGQHFYVLPEFRKTKIAWELYHSAITDMDTRGVQIRELMCFKKEIPFWKKRGFSEPVRYMMRMGVQNV